MKNLRPHSGGWQKYTRVAGRLVTNWTKAQPTAGEVAAWVRLQHTKAAFPDLLREPVEETATIAAKATAYLATKRSMPTFAERAQHIAEWVAVLGRKAPTDVQPIEVRAQLEAWLAAGYAPNSVNHRRTALMDFYTVLHGKTGYNPVRDVPRYRSPDRGPRFMPPVVLDAILHHMAPSQTRARLTVLRWTGWPHATLRRLEPAHVRWHEAVYITARRKGGGVRGGWVPIVPAAWRALREFKRLGCWGSFSASSMRQRWRAAIRRTHADRRVPQRVKDAILPDATVYDQRHSWLTHVAMVTKDDTAVGKIAQHSDPRQTQHYMTAAGDPRLEAAVRKVAEQVARRRKHPKKPKKRAL